MAGLSMLLIRMAMSMFGVRSSLRMVTLHQSLIAFHCSGGLNGSQFTLNSDGFSEPGKQAHHPLKLAMPAPTRAIR